MASLKLSTVKITNQNAALANALLANLEILNGMTMITDAEGKINDINQTLHNNGATSTSMTVWASIYNILTQFNSRGMGVFTVLPLGATYSIVLPYYTTASQTNNVQVFSLDLSSFFVKPSSTIVNPTAANYVNWPLISGSAPGSTGLSDSNYISTLVTFQNDINNLAELCKLFQ